MTLSRRKRFEAAAIAAIGTPLIEALGGTYHWHERGAEHVAAVLAAGRQPIFAFWHGRILAAMLYLRDRHIVFIISENFDGEWIARIGRRFGHLTARGSSSRGGARALVGMRKALQAGRPAGFTVDGPRGPARVAPAGAVWLASATGHPIVPLHIEASNSWTVNSWDHHQVPKPGSHLAVAIGEPIDVAGSLDAEGLEAARLQLEGALGDLEERSKAMLKKIG